MCKEGAAALQESFGTADNSHDEQQKSQQGGTAGHGTDENQWQCCA
jgi:hypothetical protein